MTQADEVRRRWDEVEGLALAELARAIAAVGKLTPAMAEQRGDRADLTVYATTPAVAHDLVLAAPAIERALSEVHGGTWHLEIAVSVRQL